MLIQVHGLTFSWMFNSPEVSTPSPLWGNGYLPPVLRRKVINGSRNVKVAGAHSVFPEKSSSRFADVAAKLFADKILPHSPHSVTLWAV
jgi:hypothetical protein